MTEKRFHYNWKTGRFKDTQSNFCATSNMRVLETQINNACYNYEKRIEKLEKENKKLKENVSRLINEAIIEILDGQRYEGERVLNEALRLLE